MQLTYTKQYICGTYYLVENTESTANFNLNADLINQYNERTSNIFSVLSCSTHNW